MPSRARWTLVATILASSMTFIDGTSSTSRCPRCRPTSTRRSPTSSGSSRRTRCSSARCILVGGSLGDQLGRRSVFLVGVVLFAAASDTVRPRADTAAAHRRARAAGRRRGVARAGQSRDHRATFERCRARTRDRHVVGVQRDHDGDRAGRGRLARSNTSSWRAVFFHQRSARRDRRAASRCDTSTRAAIRSRTGAIDWTGAALDGRRRSAASSSVCLQWPSLGAIDPLVIGALAIGAVSLVLLLVVEHRVAQSDAAARALSLAHVHAGESPHAASLRARCA